MQYCVTRVRLRHDGAIEQVEWGRLDGHALVLITEPVHSAEAEVLGLLRRGKLVWASLQTPFGMTLGGLLRIAQTADGHETLALAPGGKLQALRDMPQF